MKKEKEKRPVQRKLLEELLLEFIDEVKRAPDAEIIIKTSNGDINEICIRPSFEEMGR